MESVMYFTFFLIPVCFLAWSVMRSGLCMHNAVASVRQGAFRESLAGVKNQNNPAGIPLPYDSEAEVRRYVAYYPRPKGDVLAVGGAAGGVQATATVYFEAPYKRVIKSHDIEYHSQLTMRARITKNYEQEKGKAHEAAIAAWEAFNGFLGTLEGQAPSGPYVQ